MCFMCPSFIFINQPVQSNVMSNQHTGAKPGYWRLVFEWELNLKWSWSCSSAWRARLISPIFQAVLIDYLFYFISNDWYNERWEKWVLSAVDLASLLGVHERLSPLLTDTSDIRSDRIVARWEIISGRLIEDTICPFEIKSAAKKLQATYIQLIKKEVVQVIKYNCTRISQ